MRRVGLSVALLLGCSGALEGEVVTDPVADWSFVSDAQDVAFTTASGDSFTTVAAQPIVHEGDLYLSISTFLTLGDDALDAILEGEGVRMRANGKIYPLSATHITEPRDVDPILPVLVRKNGFAATGIRWDPQPERYPGTQMGRWFLRLESAKRVP